MKLAQQGIARYHVTSWMAAIPDGMTSTGCPGITSVDSLQRQRFLLLRSQIINGEQAALSVHSVLC